MTAKLLIVIRPAANILNSLDLFFIQTQTQHSKYELAIITHIRGLEAELQRWPWYLVERARANKEEITEELREKKEHLDKAYDREEKLFQKNKKLEQEIKETLELRKKEAAAHI